MARPEKHIPASLEEAVAELKREPRRTVYARVDELEVEIRVVEKPAHPGAGLGDRMAAAGPWQGETEEEILAILREARRSGGSEEPPAMPSSGSSTRTFIPALNGRPSVRARLNGSDGWRSRHRRARSR
jgi:hypothetical protein